MKMREKTMAAEFVSCTVALEQSTVNGNREWVERWKARLNKLVDHIPSGGGIDKGPRRLEDIIVMSDAIRFDVGFHHMSDNSYYDCWTEHTVTIRPAFDGISVRISGRNRRDIKAYLFEVMEYAFTRRIAWSDSDQRWNVDDDNEGERACTPSPQT